MYDNFEIDSILKSMVLLVDTREQQTKNLERRLDMIGLPFERRKLDVGDYSCECTLPDGDKLDFSTKVAIERKMNIEELCQCFGAERKRFKKEFERAKESGVKVYLLVENGSWEKTYNGKYKSRFHRHALVASILAYRARYNIQFDFCKTETTGRIIRDVLYREVKEFLEKQNDS